MGSRLSWKRAKAPFKYGKVAREHMVYRSLNHDQRPVCLAHRDGAVPDHVDEGCWKCLRLETLKRLNRRYK